MNGKISRGVRNVKREMLCCPNCGLRKIEVTETKSVPGRHYHCNKCGYEWQSRTVRRYRQRRALSEDLLKMILKRKSQLSSRERLLVEKMQMKGKYGLKNYNNLLRIAHKIDIDLRES